MKRLISAMMATALFAVAAPASAEPFTAEQEARIRELAIQALLEQPEILRQLVSRLEEQEAAQAQARAGAAITRLRDDLIADANAPVAGNPTGDVTVIEFMDYNCGYCKRAAPEVAKLLAADPQVRLVYREWPILSEDSAAAARLALAAREQNAYEAMHDALMAKSRVTEETAISVAQELGLDLDKLRADAKAEAVESHLGRSMALAQALGVKGTPAFVIGDQLIGGALPSEDLLAAVAAAREAARD